MKKIKDNLKYIVPIWTIAGVFGYVYEVIFYYFDKGVFLNRGSTFGPWIPIYGFGAILIYLLTKNIKNNKLLVFFVSLLSCGFLEYVTAYCLLTFSHVRLWDYNVEILNFGNINGYICLRSVLLWGLCGVFLTSIIIPLIDKIYKKFTFKRIYPIFIILAILFLIDFLINIII